MLPALLLQPMHPRLAIYSHAPRGSGVGWIVSKKKARKERIKRLTTRLAEKGAKLARSRGGSCRELGEEQEDFSLFALKKGSE